MSFVYRLDDYARYLERVGEATYVDASRRCDPARIATVWEHLREVVQAYGAPWILQIWTKDAARVAHLAKAEIEWVMSLGTTVTAQVTCTGLGGTSWEPLAPHNTLREVHELADLIGGSDHITWRYDPIIPGVHEVERFAALARDAAEQGIHRGLINFIAAPERYSRVDRRLAPLLPGWAAGMPGYHTPWLEDTARSLAAVASVEAISLACCAESAWLSHKIKSLRSAACGDYAWFTRLSGRVPPRIPYRGSRPGCGCLPYFDLGSYGQWSRCHRCVYCYAG